MLTDDDLGQILAYWRAASPAPVATVVLPPAEDPVDWFRECLSKNIHDEVYGVGLGTPDEIEGQAIRVTAITGNGPTSQANADFYVLCHTAVPILVEEIQQLRALIERLGGDAHA